MFTYSLKRSGICRSKGQLILLIVLISLLQACGTTGYGTQTYGNGNVYTGQLVNGMREGNGVLEIYAHCTPSPSCIGTPANHATYRGEFRNNMINGHGIWITDNGQRYEGEFINNIFVGNNPSYGQKNGGYSGSFTSPNLGMYSSPQNTNITTGSGSLNQNSNINLTSPSGQYLGTGSMWTTQTPGTINGGTYIRTPDGRVMSGTLTTNQQPGMLNSQPTFTPYSR